MSDKWMKEKNMTVEKIANLREKGNKAFKDHKFTLAVNLYTEAVKNDPLNYICYGNRAQAYLKLSKYREALCDSRRSITINKKWAKGYYRYAEALYELGMLDKALYINVLGCRMSPLSKDGQNLKQLTEQGDKFKEEKDKLLKLKKKSSSKRKDLPDLVSESSDGPDSGNEAPGVVTDSDENNPCVKVNKLKKKREAKKRLLPDYKTVLSSGSRAVINKLYSIAATHFQKALDMYNHTEFIRKQVDPTDVVVVKYSYGIASVLTVQFKSIMSAIDIFNSLVEDGGDTKFPVAYYGLGKAYVTLNRFSEAVKPIKRGMLALKNCLCVPHQWPETDIVIPETDPHQFEVLLNDLLHECNYPPPADAVCRFHRREEGERRVIYFKDPDFKGFIRLFCHELCILEFHSSCWKAFKVRFGEKASDKDVLDEPCPTPDCPAYINRILVFRQDSTPTKEFESYKAVPQPKKKRISGGKTTLTNEMKIARKAEKKMLRKQKRQEAHQLKSQEEDDVVDVADKNRNNSGNQHFEEKTNTVIKTDLCLEDLQKAGGTVLKREDEIVPSYKTKQKKTKKKKDKSKTILPVEVNFADNREKHLESEFTVADEDEELGMQNPTLLDEVEPFSVPVSIQDQLATFHSQFEEDLAIQNNDVAQNLFIYFEELLTEHGPLEFDSPILIRELEDFPQEAQSVIEKCDGLRGFFQKSHRFGIMDNYVCVLKDCGRVRQLSEMKQAEYPLLGVAGRFSSRASLGAAGTFSSTGSLGSNTSLVHNGTFASVGELDVLGFNDSERGSSQTDLNRKDKLDDNPALCVSPLTVSNRPKMKPIKPLVPLSKLKPNTPKPLTSLTKTIPPEFDHDPLLKTTSLNPSAVEFKPSVTEGNISHVDDLEQSTTKKEIVTKSSGYNSLDDFSLPYSVVSKNCKDSEEGQQSDINNMDDIDDIQLFQDSKQLAKHDVCVDDSGSGTRLDSVTSCDQQNTSLVAGETANWRECENWDDVDDISDTSSMKEIGRLSETDVRKNSTYIHGTSKQDDILPSRSSSRSSNHSDINADFLFRTPSPGLQHSKSTYNPLPAKTTPPSFSKEPVSERSPDRIMESSPIPLSTSLSVSSSVFQPKAHVESQSHNGFLAQQNQPISQPDSYFTLNQKTSIGSPLLQNPLLPSKTLPKGFPSPPYPLSSSNLTMLSQPGRSLISDPSVRLSGKQSTPNVGLHISSPISNPWMSNPVIGNPNDSKPLMFNEGSNNSVLGFGHTDMSFRWSAGETEIPSSKDLTFEHTSLFQPPIDNRSVDSLAGLGGDPWLKAKVTNEAETQTETEVMSVGTGTELDLDLLIEHGKKLQETNELLFVKLRQTEDEKTQIQAVGQQWLNEKSSLEQQHSAANQKIGQLEQRTMFLVREIEQLQNNLKMQKETNEYFLNQQQAQKNQIEEKEKHLLAESQRARKAEIEVLKLRLQLNLQQINQIKREATFHQHNINLFALKCQKEQQELPVQTKQVLAHWKKVLAKCELKIDQVKREYGHQLTCLESGTPLKDLPDISVSPVNSSPQEMPAMMFGQLAENHFVSYIQDLRHKRGGSLSGLSLEEIVRCITDTIMSQDGIQASSTSQVASSAASIPKPPGLTSTWGYNNMHAHQEIFMEEKDPCVICHEELSISDIATLDCNHRFHESCVRTWFREQSTCPNCRVHALLPEDFPSLK
ncbi:uncharacterized protein LOC121385873 [Gigantopelta aegis]|uniref:uncharacterized protein LOC121385873 n=1 Tax=Gigantopelta aegis TaxID=1735272 RepID=UPI001B887971|nr:uncharacterized protein LOC121385873 [Gigantopelta aegis]